MVKQKIVIKVSMEGGYSAGYLCCLMKLTSMECPTKRSKALKIVVGFCGVISASLDGEDKIVVVGDGVDPVALTRMLRKRMHYAELISVGEEKKDEEKEEKKEEEKEEKKEPTIWPYYYHAMHPYSYVVSL